MLEQLQQDAKRGRVYTYEPAIKKLRKLWVCFSEEGAYVRIGRRGQCRKPITGIWAEFGTSRVYRID